MLFCRFRYCWLLLMRYSNNRKVAVLELTCLASEHSIEKVFLYFTGRGYCTAENYVLFFKNHRNCIKFWSSRNKSLHLTGFNHAVTFFPPLISLFDFSSELQTALFPPVFHGVPEYIYLYVYFISVCMQNSVTLVLIRYSGCIFWNSHSVTLGNCSFI